MISAPTGLDDGGVEPQFVNLSMYLYLPQAMLETDVRGNGNVIQCWSILGDLRFETVRLRSTPSRKKGSPGDLDEFKYLGDILYSSRKEALPTSHLNLHLLDQNTSRTSLS